MHKETIAAIQDFGFDVYMRNERDSYLLFTNGDQIGYLEYNRTSGFTLSTVHKANATSGTGFQIARHAGSFDKALLEECFAFCPMWAFRDRDSVKKYADIEAYRNENKFNAEYKLVAKQ